MKNALCVSVAIAVLALSQLCAANEAPFPLYDHNKQCGIETPRMDPYTQEQMDQFVKCIGRQREAMGFLLGKWKSLDDEAIEQCLVSAQDVSLDTVSYVALNDCLSY